MKWNALVPMVIAAALNLSARAAVEVTAFEIQETRVAQFGDDQVQRMRPEMKILLALHGPEAESCSRYGNLKLDEAVDDQGNRLIPAKDPFNDSAKFKDYDNAFFRDSKFGNNKPADPQAEITLGLAKRGATKIARLRGSITLSDKGNSQSVELTNLKQPGKRTLSIPPEAHVGVTVDIPSGDDVHSIGIDITGDENALESLEVVDGSGQKISSGISSWSMNGGPVRKSIDLSRPLEGSMKLVAKFSLNRKLIVVPFDLKDISLP